MGGIFFPVLPVSSDPTVTSKRIYLSDWNGELTYLAMTLTNSRTSATLSSPPPPGPALRTQFAGQAPVGKLVGYFNGRAYVAAKASIEAAATLEDLIAVMQNISWPVSPDQPILQKTVEEPAV